MTFTISDIKKLTQEGKIRGYKDTMPPGADNLKMSKYRAKTVRIDGVLFDSLKEVKRYEQLKMLQNVGIISDLQTQVDYELNEGGKYSMKYLADFTYICDGNLFVEDVKPFDKKTGKFILSATFKKKAKLMKRIYNIEIKVT